MNITSVSATSAVSAEIRKEAQAAVKKMSQQEKEVLTKGYKSKAIKPLISISGGIFICLLATIVFAVLNSIPGTVDAFRAPMIVAGIFGVLMIISAIFPIIQLCYSMEEAAIAQYTERMWKEIRSGYITWQAHQIKGQVKIFKNYISLRTRKLPQPTLLLDKEKKTFIVHIGTQYSKEYKYENILRYEVYENGEPISVAMEDILQKEYVGVCHSLRIVIFLQNVEERSLFFDYVAADANAQQPTSLDKSGNVYKEIREDLKEVCQSLDGLMRDATEESVKTDEIFHEEIAPAPVQEVTPLPIREEVIPKPVQEEAVSTSIGEEVPVIERVVAQTKKEALLELKELVDSGLITQEDYEKKKKDILGL